MVSGFNHLDIGEITYTNDEVTKIDDKFTKILNQFAYNKKPLILKATLSTDSLSLSGIFVLNYLNDGSYHSFYTNGSLNILLVSTETYWTAIIRRA